MGHPSTTRITRTRSDAGLIAGYYDYAERQQIFAAAFELTLDPQSAFPFACFVGTVILTGLTPAEALELHWEPSVSRAQSWPSLNFKTWEIDVPAVGKRRKRCIPVIPQLGRLLMHWPCAKTGKLFPFPVTQRQIESLWEEALHHAGVKHIGIHNLRDTFAMMMRDAGLSISEIQEILPQG